MARTLCVMAAPPLWCVHVGDTHVLDGEQVLGGENSVERLCRKAGLNVIHGGKNALRFTPWYYLSESEVDMMMEILADVFASYRSYHGK